MMLRAPSFFAAAIKPSMPPKSATDVAVFASTEELELDALDWLEQAARATTSAAVAPKKPIARVGDVASFPPVAANRMFWPSERRRARRLIHPCRLRRYPDHVSNSRPTACAPANGSLHLH